MTKCIGCGAQILDDKKLCERCFRIRNYNEYKIVNKNNSDYLEILKQIKNDNDLTLLVVDIFGIDNISQYEGFKNLIVVITKKDILPKKISDNKLLSYIKINCLDKIVVSSNKNYNFDQLYNLINNYKKTNKVYIIGNTNMGKSTLINKLIKNYSDINNYITTSMLPSTTLGSIEIKLNDDLVIVDTPGIIDEGDICNYVDEKLLKKITIKKEIKPITYQMKSMQTIKIENILDIVSNDSDITLYVSNELKKERLYFKENKEYKEFLVDKNTDIVIKGLGFITVHKKSKILINTLTNVNVYTRTSLIS